MFRPYRERLATFQETYGGFSTQLMIDTDTGHLQFDPMPPPALLDHYYNHTFTREQLNPTPENEFTPQLLETLRSLKTSFLEEGGLPSDFTYHDVGCGFGGSVWAMQQFGVRRASGNEVNRAWVEAANPSCDYKLSYAPLEEALAALPHKVDGYFSAHVIEHVADPLAMLQTMARYMSDDGMMQIITPNIHNTRTLRCRVRDHGAYAFPVHLHYFTPKSLAALIRAAGLEPVRVETRSMFDDQASVEQCAQLLGWELAMFAVKPGNRIAKRETDLDARCEWAFRYFNTIFQYAVPLDSRASFPGIFDGFGRDPSHVA